MSMPRQTRNDETIATRYLAGDSLSMIAAQVGCHTSWVAKVLERLGIPRRRQGSPEADPQRDKRVADLYASDLTLKEVAEAVGMSYGGVCRVLQRLGVERRSKGTRRNRPTKKAAVVLKPSQPKRDAVPRFADLDAIVPAGVKVTICPAGKDQRFTATGSEPFFSRGAVLPVSPWVQAVTGSR